MPEFDLNVLRIVVTVLSFITFVAIVAWALAKRNQAGFDEAAQLPFVAERSATPVPVRPLSNPAVESRDE
ncbi:MAG: cbb3-type cytochrome c oxidase subunit 3 [Ideonella sp.]